jgi:prophage antirepressor-like protein
MLQIFNFEAFEIRTTLIDNEPWFVAKDIGQVLGYKTDSAMSNAKKDLENDEIKTSFKMKSSDNRDKYYDLISESGLYSLIMRSRKPIAKPFQKWVTRDVLPEIRKTGSYSLENSQTSNQPQPDQNIINNIFTLEKSFINLRPSEASKILMTEKLYKKLDLETCYLPQYTEEKLTRSLTYLLKKYEIKISTQKANLKLLEVGILEKLERDSSCGNKKYFYSITEKGLEFGKNLISPKNERETQPHFYESKFLELIKLF